MILSGEQRRDLKNKINPVLVYEKNIQAWSEERGIYDVENGGTAVSQFMKLLEEFGETVNAITKGRTSEIKDGIGDQKVCVVNTLKLTEVQHDCDITHRVTLKDQTTLRQAVLLGRIANEFLKGGIHDYYEIKELLKDFENTLMNSADINNVDYVECIEAAYDDIKDRKGRMINRVFVKESDLPENNLPPKQQKESSVKTFGEPVEVRAPYSKEIEPKKMSENVQQFQGIVGETLKNALETKEDQTPKSNTRVVDYTSEKLKEGFEKLTDKLDEKLTPLFVKSSEETKIITFKLEDHKEVDAFQLLHQLQLEGFNIAEINPDFKDFCEEFPDNTIKLDWINPDLLGDDMDLIIVGNEQHGYTRVTNFMYVDLTKVDQLTADTLANNMIYLGFKGDVVEVFYDWCRKNPTVVLGVSLTYEDIVFLHDRKSKPLGYKSVGLPLKK